MNRIIVLGGGAFVAGMGLVLLKLEGHIEVPWPVAMSPWWGYALLAGIVYALVCCVVTYNLLRGK